MEEGAEKPQMFVFTDLAVIGEVSFDNPFWHSNYQPCPRHDGALCPVYRPGAVSA